MPQARDHMNRDAGKNLAGRPYGTRMNVQLILGKPGKENVDIVHTSIHEFVKETKPKSIHNFAK